MNQATDWTKVALYGATGIVAIILGVALSILMFGPFNPESAYGDGAGDGGQPPIGGPFELVDQNGQTRTEEMLQGEVTLLYFGFTHCPDFCPTELTNLVAVKKELAGTGLTPQVVFVSVDPERDTVEVMKGYVEFFDPAFIGLTGTPEKVAQAAAAYRVYYEKRIDPEDPEDYAVDHMTLVYAIGPDGRYLTHFSANTNPKIIAQTLLEKTGRTGGQS